MRPIQKNKYVRKLSENILFSFELFFFQRNIPNYPNICQHHIFCTKIIISINHSSLWNFWNSNSYFFKEFNFFRNLTTFNFKFDCISCNCWAQFYFPELLSKNFTAFISVFFFFTTKKVVFDQSRVAYRRHLFSWPIWNTFALIHYPKFSRASRVESTEKNNYRRVI